MKKKQPKNFRLSRQAIRCLEDLKNTSEFETETQIVETAIQYLWFEFREQVMLIRSILKEEMEK